MDNDERIVALTEAVGELGVQMKMILDLIGSRAVSEEDGNAVVMDGTPMSLAEYENRIRRLELDNRLREARRLERLAEIAEGAMDG